MKYFRPLDLDEYFQSVQSLRGQSYSILSGGTDLMPGFRQNISLPENIIDIKKIQNLDGITEQGTEIRIGALTSIETLKRSPIIRDSFKALWMATHDFAGIQIRHRATLGGNICNASPAGDMLPPLYAFHAQLSVLGPQGEKLIPIEKFITGPGNLTLEPGDLLHSIILSKRRGQSTFYKLGLRRAMAISVVNFAIVYDFVPGKQRFRNITIAAGAVAPTVVYLTSLMNTIINDDQGLDEIINLIDHDINPIDDIRATAAYRRIVLKNMIAYTIKDIQEQGSKAHVR